MNYKDIFFDVDIVLDCPVSDDEDDVKTYLNKVANYPLITEKKELELSVIIRKGAASLKQLEIITDGDKKYDSVVIDNLKKAAVEMIEAARELALSNQKYVVSIARKNLNRGLNVIELVKIGNKSLIKAAMSYDFTRGIKFSVNATWHITSAIEKAVKSLSV